MFLKMRKYLSLILVVLLLVIVLPNQKVNAADEYDMMRTKWLNTLTGGTAYNTADTHIAAKISDITSAAQSNWDSMNKNGGRTYLWSDLSSTTNSSDITNTYRRIQTMALAYNTTGSTLRNNATLLNDIKNALDWMYTNRYNENTTRYGNWWDWEIGTPLTLNDCTVLMYSNLSSTQTTNYMNAVKFFNPDPTKEQPGNYTSSGANRSWKCKVTAVRGVIVKKQF